MSFVIGSACVDITDRACVEECPVDCIYVGDRSAYVNPDECIDCSACEPVCPVEAIVPADQIAAADLEFVADNARFFSDVLPGRGEPLGNPGGAANVGAIGVDTPLVTAWPAK